MAPHIEARLCEQLAAVALFCAVALPKLSSHKHSRSRVRTRSATASVTLAFIVPFARVQSRHFFEHSTCKGSAVHSEDVCLYMMYHNLDIELLTAGSEGEVSLNTDAFNKAGDLSTVWDLLSLHRF